MEPNIFNYATSELSQDAFLLWILEWANPTNNEYDQSLCQTAQKFLRFLIDKESSYTIHQVVCQKQQNNIDVLAIVNDEIALIIEDKIFTKEHNNQIIRYQQSVLEKRERSYEIKTVYLKTGNESLTHLKGTAQKEHFKIVMRKDLLKIFSNSGSKNIILRDFIERLNTLNYAYSIYQRVPYKEWKNKGSAWQGFYTEIEEKYPDIMGWSYQNIYRNSFWALYWHYRWLGNCGLYFQIENGKVCVKIEDHQGTPLARTRKWQILEIAQKQGINLKQPQKLYGNKKHPTIAYLDEDYFFDDNIVNVDNVIKKMKSLECLIDLMPV